VAVLMGLSLSNLNVDNKAIKYFDADSQIRIDDEVINKYFAGSMLFSITLKADAPDAFKSMDTLEAIEKIQDRLAQHDDVGFSYSPVNFIKLLNQRLLSGDESDFKLPKGNDDLLAQYFFLYESSDGRGIFDTVDQKYQNARIIVFNHSDQSSVMERTLNDVLPYAKSVLPASMEIEASGFGELLVSTKNEVIYGQISSLSWSLVGVLILLSLVFRSVVFGILGTLPLTLTVFINFSIMPLLGMDLDIGTSLVAAIAIGVGVDYAIHFISRYRQQRMDGLEVNPAIHNALLAVYRPVIFNTLVLSLGFSMLGLSTFAALANLGYLIAMTMVISAISTLFILPVLIRFFPGSSELSATTTNLTPEEAV
jgi:predicted RND superfamily exporter protein